MEFYRRTMSRETTESSWAAAIAEIGGLEDDYDSGLSDDDDGVHENESDLKSTTRGRKQSLNSMPSLSNKKSIYSTPSTARSNMVVITERSSGRETIELFTSMEEDYDASFHPPASVASRNQLENESDAFSVQSPRILRYEQVPKKEEMFEDSKLKKICVLGLGSFGRVLLCKDQKNHYYAVKRIPATKLTVTKHVERTRIEREALVQLQGHAHIVNLFFAYRTHSHLILGFEYCPGGELFHHLRKRRKLGAATVIFYAAELGLAFGHCHEHGVVYRDCKPENILLNENGHVKLADFGLAKLGVKHPFHGAHSICGTLEYIAPDILANREHGYGYAVDYWGLGILSYELLTGFPPFRNKDKAKLFKAIKSQPLPINNKKIPQPCAQFLHDLLERNPHHRIHSLATLRSHSVFSFYGFSLDTISTSTQPPIRPCDPHSFCCFLNTPTGIEKAHWINFDLQFTTLSVHDRSDELKRPRVLPSDSIAAKDWNFLRSSPQP